MSPESFTPAHNTIPELAPLPSRRESRQREVKAPRRRLGRGEFIRSMTSKFTAVGAVVGVAALIVSTSLPAAAFYTAQPASATKQTGTVNSQSFVAEATAALATPAALNRDGYSVTLPPPPRARSTRIFAPSGGLLYSPNPNGTIQWPFPTYVPIASGFGPRSAPCGGCSSIHDGLDMPIGGGTPIGAIAPGVVSASGSIGSGYGTYLVIDHVVNGQLVKSLYAHMLAGSATVAVGQTVTVAQTIGLVGSTGASTGNHLHLGISIGGTFIDPYAWLKANAN